MALSAKSNSNEFDVVRTDVATPQGGNFSLSDLDDWKSDTYSGSKQLNDTEIVFGSDTLDTPPGNARDDMKNEDIPLRDPYADTLCSKLFYHLETCLVKTPQLYALWLLYLSICFLSKFGKISLSSINHLKSIFKILNKR